MKAAYVESEQNTSFQLLGANSLLGSSPRESSQGEVSLLSAPSTESNMDQCSFATMFSEPSEAVLLSFAESSEACGSIASVSGSDSISVSSFGGGECCGSIASSSSSSFSCAC